MKTWHGLGIIVEECPNSDLFKRLCLHGIIERVQGTYKYSITAYGKEIIAAGLTVRNLMLIPALA